MNPFPAGSTIGILGSGQLGRMSAQAAAKLGYLVQTYSPDSNTPTGQVAQREWVGNYEDRALLERFLNEVDVVTYEFENVPSDTASQVAAKRPIRPSVEVLFLSQNRLREKKFFGECGLKTTPFLGISDRKNLDLAAVQKLGFPLVVKTAGSGYDGKGQRKVANPKELIEAVSYLKGELIAEKLVEFEFEFSVIVARTEKGAVVTWGPIENSHYNHILDVSVFPSRVPSEEAKEILKQVVALSEKLKLVGVLCIEFFWTKDGRILANELAPRPHNSGHLTIEGCTMSQFEAHIRSVTGQEFESPTFIYPAIAMANLLGEHWEKGTLDPAQISDKPNLKLHLYGKTEVRPGRKMGHITAWAANAEEAVQRVLLARKALFRN